MSIPALVAAVGTLLAKLLGDGLLRWVAAKAALLFLFVVILPIVLNNLLGDLLDMVFSLVTENTAGVTTNLSPTLQVDGLAAWFCDQTNLSACLSVIVSALVCKLVLKMIPIVRL